MSHALTLAAPVHTNWLMNLCVTIALVIAAFVWVVIWPFVLMWVITGQSGSDIKTRCDLGVVGFLALVVAMSMLWFGGGEYLLYGSGAIVPHPLHLAVFTCVNVVYAIVFGIMLSIRLEPAMSS